MTLIILRFYQWAYVTPGKRKQVIYLPEKSVQLNLVIGKYAQDCYLKKLSKKNLTENVANYQDFLPKYFPLPHP